MARCKMGAALLVCGGIQPQSSNSSLWKCIVYIASLRSLFSKALKPPTVEYQESGCLLMSMNMPARLHRTNKMGSHSEKLQPPFYLYFNPGQENKSNRTRKYLLCSANLTEFHALLFAWKWLRGRRQWTNPIEVTATHTHGCGLSAVLFLASVKCIQVKAHKGVKWGWNNSLHLPFSFRYSRVRALALLLLRQSLFTSVISL